MHRPLSHAAGTAWIIGGGLWVTKAASIVLTGIQPPLVFELAPVFIALGLIGLYLTLPAPRPVPAQAGLVLLGAGLLGQTAATVYGMLPGIAMPTGEAFVFPYSLFVLIGNLGNFAALPLIGLAFRRRADLAPAQRTAPLIVGLAAVPLAATLACHVEAPIVLIGLTWMVLGWVFAVPTRSSGA